MATSGVSVDGLQGGPAGMRWFESLALVQQMAELAEAAGWPGSAAAFRLEPGGKLRIDDRPSAPARTEPPVVALAGFLEHLLPRPGDASVEPRVPAGLRYALLRARGGVTAPPFASLADFSASLVRFEHGDRQVLLADVSRRLASSGERRPAPAPIPPRERPAPSAVPARSSPTTPARDWDDTPFRQESPAAPPAVVPARRSAGPLLTLAAVLSILVAATVFGAAILVSGSDARDTRWRQALQPAVERVRDAVSAATGSAPPKGSQEAPHAVREAREAPADGTRGTGDSAAPKTEASPPPASPPLTSPPPASLPDASVRGTNGSTSDDGSPAPGPNARDAQPGDMVEALDVGNRPVFSPSFAADGSAIFFDQNDPHGGSALREARTDAGRVVHVLSVLDDGARNYHPRLSPDGSQVAFDSDRDGLRGVYLSDRSGQNIRRVSGEGYAAVPSWSPDGKRLAFVKAEPDNPRVWNIWSLDLATGEAARLTSYRVGQPWGASWLPDGHRICYSHEDRIIVLDTATGESATYLSPRKGVLVRTPAVSPDGRLVIFQLYHDGAWLLDLSNGAMRKVLDDPTAEEFAWSPDGTRVAFHSRRDKQWGIWLLSQRTR